MSPVSRHHLVKLILSAALQKFCLLYQRRGGGVAGAGVRENLEHNLESELFCPPNVEKLEAYWVSGCEKSETLCVLCLHSSEAGHADVEEGGVDCGHGAAILNTCRAVVEGGDSVGSARVSGKGIVSPAYAPA